MNAFDALINSNQKIVDQFKTETDWKFFINQRLSIDTEELSILQVCEDDYLPYSLDERSLILVKLSGNKNFEEKVEPLIKQLCLNIVNRGVTYEGIAITFSSVEDAALFRTFYDGITMVNSEYQEPKKEKVYHRKFFKESKKKGKVRLRNFLNR